MSLNPLHLAVPTLLAGRLLGGSIAQSQREMLDLQLGFASGTRLQRVVMIREPPEPSSCCRVPWCVGTSVSTPFLGVKRSLDAWTPARLR